MKNYINELKALAERLDIDFFAGNSRDNHIGLFPSDNPSVLVGRGGDDFLMGRGGTDILIGGRGDDRIFGGDGDDYLRGDLGDDTMKGGDGDDVFTAFQGNDTLFGGRGSDTFIFKGVEKGNGDDFATIKDFGHDDQIFINGRGDVEAVRVNGGVMLSMDGNDLALITGKFGSNGHRDAVEDLLDQTETGHVNINDLAADMLLVA